MSAPKVIVFGPTGGVGSAAALAAHEHGAHVVLAMRDTKKAIPGLTAEAERAGRYERVQSDLTQPETVAQAVKQTGARHAFIYLAHHNTDHMAATLQALRDAGIELLVFLSSCSVQEDDISSIPPEQIIPYLHAQVELQIERTFGRERSVCVRPGAFTTNAPLWWGDGIKAGSTEVGIFKPEAKFDWIVPADIGVVSGTILVKGPQDGQRIVFLFGPQQRTQRDAVTALAKILGREIKIAEMTEQQALDRFTQRGIPESFAQYLVDTLSNSNGAGDYYARYLEEGTTNLTKYAGRLAQKWEDWVKENKGVFGA